MANARAKARIEARIRERAAYCVEFELNDPRSAFITITGCQVSPDLSVAKILYSVYGSEGDKSRATHMLADATGFVRKQVARVLKTRRMPRVIWEYDNEAEVQDSMEKAIAKALDHDREINPAAHLEVEEEAAAPETEKAAVDREYIDFLDAQEREDPA